MSQTWASYADVTQRVASGVFRVKVEATYTIEEIKAAHAEREGRRGKILALPSGPIAQTFR